MFCRSPRGARVERKHKAPKPASAIVGTVAPRVARRRNGRRASRVAEGILVSNYSLLKSDGPISGFVNNADTLADRSDAHWQTLVPKYDVGQWGSARTAFVEINAGL